MQLRDGCLPAELIPALLVINAPNKSFSSTQIWVLEANHRKASSQAFCSQACQRYYAKQKAATQKARITRVQSHKAPQLGGLGGWPDLTYV